MERPSTGAAVGRHPQTIATDTNNKTIALRLNRYAFIAQ
jgi:hypothetical protein